MYVIVFTLVDLSVLVYVCVLCSMGIRVCFSAGVCVSVGVYLWVLYCASVFVSVLVHFSMHYL